jgi:predicted esterase
MPYTLVHNGLTREFDFFAPPGWQYWVARAWVDHGRIGLPLVVALHGAGQDPLEFQEKWFFPNVWALDLDGELIVDDIASYERLLENQFFVIYPYGVGWASSTLHTLAYDPVAAALLARDPTPLPDIPGSAPGTNLRPLYREDRPARGWDSGIAGVVTGPGIKDVSFIKAVIGTMNEKLRGELLSAADVIDQLAEDFPWEINVVPAPYLPKRPFDAPKTLFDVDRRFLFGYSNGAMLGHRLVRKMPDYWAAVWGMSTTVGGKPHQGVGDVNAEDAVVNLPQEGDYTVSFFAHHGEQDEIFPPGRVNAVTGQLDVLGTPDFELQLPRPVAPIFRQYLAAGFNTELPDGTRVNGLTFLPGFLPLAQGWRGYIEYNGLSEVTVRRPQKGLGPSSEGEEPDLGVPSVGLPPSGPLDDLLDNIDIPILTAYSYSSGDTGIPLVGYSFAANPIAVMYIDPNMSHTKFTEHINRYFFASDVWEFFRYHPRRQRIVFQTLP